MDYLIVAAVVLAIIGYLVYTIRKGASAETELETKNATLTEEAKVADERVSQMEDAALKHEYELREQETNTLPPATDRPRTSIPFLRKGGKGPGPDDLN